MVVVFQTLECSIPKWRYCCAKQFLVVAYLKCTVCGSFGMTRTRVSLPSGLRLSDHLGLGMIPGTYPRIAARDGVERTGRGSVCRRSLSARSIVYHVIAMALFRSVRSREVLRCLKEGCAGFRPRFCWEYRTQRRSRGRARVSVQCRSRRCANPPCGRWLFVIAGIAVPGLATCSLYGSTLALPDRLENRSFLGLDGLRGAAPAFRIRRSRCFSKSAPGLRLPGAGEA